MLFIKDNIYSSRLLALLLVLTVASCKLHERYKRPDLPLPAQFSASADTASIADMKWEQFFTDPALRTLISKGLQHNYDLQIAIKNIEIANQQLKQARTLELPQLNIQVLGQREFPADNSLDGVTAKNFLNQTYIDAYSANATLSWEADVWGKLHMQKQAARAQYLQTYEATMAVQTRLIADIAQSYYNLLMLDEQLIIATNNLHLADTSLLLARLQKDAGNTTLLAVEQVEAQRQATAQLIPGLEQSIALQEHALSILTGEVPGSISRNMRLSGIEIPASLATGVPVDMVSRRPDVRAAEFALIAANKQVGIAQANMYPSLNITAAGGLTSFKASNWFNIPASLFGLVTGSITAPVFEHRVLKTRYKIAQTQREQSVLQFRQSVLNAVGEVSDAMVKEQKLGEQQELANVRVNTLHKAINDAQLLFRSDMATYLEVITAQSAALQAELELASIRRQRLGADVDLYRALGGGRN